jgi:hypothetical protein
MTAAFDYRVMPDPDGQGWLVTALGHLTHSLPYDTMDEAISMAEDLVRRHPGSSLVVTDEPPALTPVEIEHRIAA